MAHSSPDSTSSHSSSNRSGSGSYSGGSSFGRSGWCGTCGLRRGPDGRCSNCDAWWTSPLVQYGAPLIVASTFLLLMGVSLLRPKSTFLAFGKPPISVPPASNRGYSQIPVPTPGSPGGMYQPIAVPQSRPTSYAPPPPPPSSVSSAAPVLSPAAVREAALFANQQQLNRMVLSVDAAMRSDDVARQQSAHSFNGGGIRSVSRAMPTMSAASSVY